VAGERLIDDYIAELRANLTVPRGVARRILAETRDHLDEAAMRFADEGVPNPASAAIAAFGEPALVARRFAEQLALSAARRANRRGFALLALLLAVLALWGIGAVRIGGPGAGLMVVLGGQIALVAGAVSLARAHVAARFGALDELRLRYILRGHTTVAVCAAIVAATLLLNGRAPIAAIAILGGSIAWALAATLRAGRRLAPFLHSPAAGTAADAIADLAATAADGAAALAVAAPFLREPLAAARRLVRATCALPLARDPPAGPYRPRPPAVALRARRRDRGGSRRAARRCRLDRRARQLRPPGAQRSVGAGGRGAQGVDRGGAGAALLRRARPLPRPAPSAPTDDAIARGCAEKPTT
jgi:hypothetical protein